MATLVSCPKHNTVACLEKNEQNAQLHMIVDFLTRSSIYYSLRVSPTVSTSLIEQFWNTVTSKTVNDVSYIKAKMAGKTVSISEASIKRDLLFNDVDGIDCLTNQEIYENLQSMRNLDAKKQFIMYPRFVQVFLNNQLSNLPAPLDNLPIPILTKKVFTNIAKQGLHFSGHVTPLFPNMLAQAVVDEGEGSEQLTEPQPTPSTTQPSTGDQPPVTESSYSPDTTQDPRVNLEGTSKSQRDHVQIPYDSPLSGGHISNRAEGSLNLDELLVLCTNLSNRVLALEISKDAQAAEILKLKTRIQKLEKKLGKKEYVSKQERKNAKSKPTLDAFDDLDADLAHGMDYIETEEVMNEGRQSNENEELNLDVDTEVIAKDKGSGKKGGSTVSTARPEVDTARPEVDTARLDIDTTRPEVHTANAPVSTTGVTISTADPEVSVVEPRTTPTTTSIFDDEDITMAQTLIKMKRERKGKRTKLQQEEREEYTIKEREKFLAETIDAQRKFRAVQRAAKIRSRPPTKYQLRNLMMTYLKNIGGYKISQRKQRFEEIQRMLKDRKRELMTSNLDSDDAVKDSKKAAGEDTLKKEEVLKEPDSTKIERMNKEDAGERVSDVSKKRKGGPRMKRIHGAEDIYYRIFRSDGSSRWIKTFSKMVIRFDRLDLKMNSGRIKKDGILRARISMRIVGFIHTLTLEYSIEIHMLAERKYPLTKETLKRMMSLKLIAESTSDSAYDLLRFNQKHQELASLEQTTSGKDFLNPLMADSLPKTIWVSTHHASQ
ncbi:hypothetical protein Tco_0833698 [Tanacetum coccineum]